MFLTTRYFDSKVYSMKRLISITLALMLVSVSCNISLPSMIRGSGNIVSKSYEVNDFDQVELNTIGEVRIEQGNSPNLIIETDDNILPLLEVKVEGSNLTLGVKNDENVKPSQGIIYHIVVQTLSALTTNSSGDLYAGHIEGGSLEIFLNGSGSVSLKDVTVKDFLITSNGSGNVRVDTMDADSIRTVLLASGNVQLAGVAISHIVESNGSGDVRADSLKTSNTGINLQAGGNAVVWVLDSLDVTLIGSGRIEYYGAPRVTQKLAGSGTLLSLGDKSS